MNSSPRSRSYRWWLLPLGVAAGLGLAAGLAFRVPDRFESFSVLMIAPKVRGAPGAADVIEDTQKFADAQLQLMLSGQVINRTYLKLQEGRDNAGKLVRPRLDAAAGKGNTFVMKVTATNFDYAQKFSTAWAQEFIEFKKQQRQTLLGASEAALQRDALLYEQKLERARTSLEDFRKKNNVTSLQDAGLRAQQALEQAKAAQQQLLAERRVIEDASGEQLLTASSEALPARVEGGRQSESALSVAMMNRYLELRLAVKRAENRLADPAAGASGAETDRTKAELQIARIDLKSLLELAEEQRLARLAVLKARAESFDPVIARLTDEVFNTVSIQNEYIRLQEDEKIYKDNLDVVRKQMANLVSSNGDEEQFQTVEIGGGSSEAVGPNRPWLIGLGGLAGLILGLILTAASGRPRPPTNGEPAVVGAPAPQR